ncbi:MAG: hypothetical protein P8J86_10300 [Phycisphaerales bacterium]|nr:hypothetical protein [Phycisphaerales bacterium]
MSGISQVVATCFALTAFAVAMVSGLIVDNPPLTVLVRSLIVLIVCYGLGWLVGSGVARTMLLSSDSDAPADIDQEHFGDSSEASSKEEIQVSSGVAEDEKIPAPL